MGDRDATFQSANRLVLANNFKDAVPLYRELMRQGGDVGNPGVVHNCALALALGGDAAESMGLLDDNMQRFEQYDRSFRLAAELYRRAARSAQDNGAQGQEVAGLLERASALLKHTFARDMYDPQSCVVASEILASCVGSEDEAISWHIKALGAAKARGSKLATNFAAVMLETFTDEALHIFSTTPLGPVVSGSLPASAMEAGRCLVVVTNETDPGLVGWEEWPRVILSYGNHPMTTGEARVHVRTHLNWVAVYEAARLVLHSSLYTGVVWNAQLCPSCPPEGSLASEALVAVWTHPLAAFALRPSSLEEMHILRALYNTDNVPPSRPSQVMATRTWDYLVKDSELDVERVSFEDSVDEEREDEEGAHGSAAVLDTERTGGV